MSLFQKFRRSLGWGIPMTHITAGKSAPEFSLNSIDGQQHSLSQALQHGPVVLAFFKISCPICQFTFPYLQRLADRYTGDGITFWGVSQDDAKSTAKFNLEYGVKFPTLLDSQGYPVSNLYGLTSVPTILLVAPDRKVAVSGIGFAKADLEEISDELAGYRKTEPIPFFRPDESV